MVKYTEEQIIGLIHRDYQGKKIFMLAKRRLANLLIAVGVCRIFFLSDTPQAYDGMLSWLALLLVCSLFFPLLSVYRFKQGCQD